MKILDDDEVMNNNNNSNGKYEVNGNSIISNHDPKFEIPLPFGYHMDLDFLRYCSQDLINGETLERLKALKKSHKKQRKIIKGLIHENSNNVYFNKKSPYEKIDSTVTSTPYKHKKKFDTFPRASPEEFDKLSRQLSNSSISSVSTTTSIGSPESLLLTSQHSYNGSGHYQDRMETESVGSICSEMSTTTLRNVREQMAKCLSKLKEYEQQIEKIPILQVKLSVLKEEKRLLILKLKQKELELSRSSQNNSSKPDLHDTDEEEILNLTNNRHSSYFTYVGPNRPRARSESPFGNSIQPNNLKRSNSVSCNNEYESFSTLSPHHQRSELNLHFLAAQKPPTKETACNTEPKRSLDRGSNTNQPRLIAKAINTSSPRTFSKSTKTVLSMDSFILKEDAEKQVQEAIFKTEEELMGCPLLQKAMARVEEEALKGHSEQKVHVACQVGDENLIPFMIDVALQAELMPVLPKECNCKLKQPVLQRDFECQTTPIHASIAVETSAPASRKHSRDFGMCTEKWVEVIKASKQTDTEDFAFKDTPSPRVVDMILPDPPKRRSLKRSSSVSGSPLSSRRSSSSKSTMTESNKKRASTIGIGTEEIKTKSIGLSTMMLPLSSSITTPGSPLATPDLEKPPSSKLNLCDKCNNDIRTVAQGVLGKEKVISPPSPNTPWVSKIPRLIPENPDVAKLKSATSTSSLSDRPSSPLRLQRSKSSLTPSTVRKFQSSPTRNCTATPPLYPASSSRRTSSPLTRSFSSAEKKSMIPKLSQKQDSKKDVSLIPRVVTPPALRKMFPKNTTESKLADRSVVRKAAYNKDVAGISNSVLENYSLAGKFKLKLEEKMSESTSEQSNSKIFTPIKENHTKVEPSKEMKNALKIINDALGLPSSRSNAQVTNALNIVQQEWFKTSSTKQSNPLEVEDYLDTIEDISKGLLEKVVNLTDINGNTALHYSVSHGNFDVVSVLLDSKVAYSNILNKAGYTCIMLISLAQITTMAHKAVVQRLFTLGDINVRASQHGQTALMLAVSHGRLDMVKLLSEAGANINLQDEDGSTALMCAAEHNHIEIVKYLLLQPDIIVNTKDNDGLTALAIAMEAGHRDIGVVLYASMSFSRGASPYSSVRSKNSHLRSPISPSTPHRSRHNSSSQ